MNNAVRQTALMNTFRRSVNGFTLIELVIVVVLLSLLAAVAIPRYLDVTDQAEDATIEGVAGGFATGVGLVRAEWELEARPRENNGANQSFVTLDGIQIGIDKNTGYPTGQLSNDSSSEDDTVNDLDCESIFSLIMQSAPTITSSWSNRPFETHRYFTSSSDGTGSGGNDLCFYYLSKSVRNLTVEPVDDTVGDGFIYDPRIGQVIVFNNNTSE